MNRGMGHSRTRRALRAVVLAAAALLVSAVLGSGSARASTSESVVLFYQQIGPADEATFAGAGAVVTAGQANDARAVATIHAAGAKAFKYLDFYWYPADRSFEGIDIGAHLGWAFCEHGDTPLVGRRGAGVNWYFLDANERPARVALDAYLAHLKSLGYDGIFADRGSASLRGHRGALAWHASTCTQHPVAAGHRRFANIYVHVLRDASAKLGLSIILNYAHPFTGVRLRPDPANPSCRGEGPPARCTFLSDIWRWVGSVADEHRVPDVGVAAFQAQYRVGLAAERHSPTLRHPRLIREVKTATRNRNRAYYRWARARLFRMTMVVNTGDDGCPGAHGRTCFHFGTYPLLTRVRLGAPLGRLPVSVDCRGRSPVSCIWIRRYAGGMTIVNPSLRPRRLPKVRMRLGSCRDVEDVFRSTMTTPYLLSGGRCVRRVGYALPPLGGRILVYLSPAA